MADYAKMKNSELEVLLKERNLPTNGRKAEMVARLQEADAAKPASTPMEEPAKVSSTTQPVQATTASKSEEQPTPEAAPDADASKTVLTKTHANGEAIENKEEEAQDNAAFSANLATTSLDEEIARRKKRAEKFGMTETESDAIRNLERQKRFGTGPKSAGEGDADEAGVSKLDEALSTKKPRGAKRGRDDNGGASYEDEHLIKRRGGFRGRGRGRRPRGRPQSDRADGSGAPKWMNDVDRTARDKRSAKFG